MDRTLLRAQLAGCVAQLAGATGAWSWTPRTGGDPVAIVGVAGPLVSDDPTLEGESEHVLALRCASSALPDPRPVADDLIDDQEGRAHRVARVLADLHGITTFILVA